MPLSQSINYTVENKISKRKTLLVNQCLISKFNTVMKIVKINNETLSKFRYKSNVLSLYFI